MEFSPAPERPVVVLVAAGLLLGSAAVLLLAWVIWPESVVSNGARVFFVMLWSVLAYTAYRGLRWVRIAIGLLFLGSAWGAANAASAGSALADTTSAEVLCGLLQLAGLVLLCTPAAGRWFAAIRELEVG